MVYLYGEVGQHCQVNHLHLECLILTFLFALCAKKNYS